MEGVAALAVAVARIEEKLDALKADVQGHDTRTSTVINDHEMRLRKVESWRGRVLGAVAVLSFVAALISDTLFSLFKRH